MKTIILIFLTIAAILIVFFSAFSLNTIVGSSMSPSLKPNQQVLFAKYFLVTTRTRGDIVIYNRGGDTNFPLVGRIIALPGEAIKVSDGKVYLKSGNNVTLLNENYLHSDSVARANIENSWVTIGDFKYLITNDQRDNLHAINLNTDQIHQNDIVGKYFLSF